MSIDYYFELILGLDDTHIYAQTDGWTKLVIKLQLKRKRNQVFSLIETNKQGCRAVGKCVKMSNTY